MRRFRVLYDYADPVGIAALTFDALDVTDALSQLARYHSRRPFELWCDGSFSGRVQRIVESNASYWRLLEWAAQWPRLDTADEAEPFPAGLAANQAEPPLLS